jgi:hypothetical protein
MKRSLLAGSPSSIRDVVGTFSAGELIGANCRSQKLGRSAGSGNVGVLRLGRWNGGYHRGQQQSLQN